MFAVVTLTHLRNFGSRFPFAFVLRLHLPVPTVSKLCVRTFHNFDTHLRNAKVFLDFVHRNLLPACVFFALLATFLALAEFTFHLPCPGEDIEFHRIVMGLHVCCRREDASALQVIFCCHAQSIKVSKFTNVQLKVRLQWLRRVRNGARQFHLVGNGIRAVCLTASPHQFQKLVQMVFRVLNSGTKLVHLRLARRVPCCLHDRTFRTSDAPVCKLQNSLFQASSRSCMLLSA